MPATKRSTSPPFEIRESPVHGRGAFATRRIRAGARIGEYTGERISTRKADARYADDQIESHHTFLFAVDARTVIDATHEGSDVRFINHSCEPSCEAQVDEKRIFIVALRDIAPGEELFYDYALQREQEAGPSWRQLYVCRCGAPSCRGTLLRPPTPKRGPAAAKQKTARARRVAGTR